MRSGKPSSSTSIGCSTWRNWEAYISRLEYDELTIAAALREMAADRVHVEAAGFLETSLVKSTEEQRAGMQVGPSTLVSLIGRGGMG